jgi:hypothetical protein
MVPRTLTQPGEPNCACRFGSKGWSTVNVYVPATQVELAVRVNW